MFLLYITLCNSCITLFKKTFGYTLILALYANCVSSADAETFIDKKRLSRSIVLASRATAQIEVWVKHNQWYYPVGEGGACVESSQWERGGRGRGLCLRANRALQASIDIHDPGFLNL